MGIWSRSGQQKLRKREVEWSWQGDPVFLLANWLSSLVGE